MYSFTMIGQSLYSGRDGLHPDNSRLIGTDWANAGFEVKCGEIYDGWESFPMLVQNSFIGPAGDVKQMREQACASATKMTTIGSYSQVLHFQNFPDGFVTMFHLLIQNNWHVTMSAALALSSRIESQLATHLFFYGNFVVMVIVLSNVLVSFIVDSYMFVVDLGSQSSAKLDKSVPGVWAAKRRDQADGGGSDHPIQAAMLRTMKGSSELRNSHRRRDFRLRERVQVFRFGHTWRDATITSIQFEAGAWLKEGRKRKYGIQLRGSEREGTPRGAHSKLTEIVVEHHCIRTPVHVREGCFRESRAFALVRILCGDNAEVGCSCLRELSDELPHPQCVQCNEEFGARRILCGKQRARCCCCCSADNHACDFFEIVLAPCLKVVAEFDQVQCAECARVAATLPVCRSCAPNRIAPTWQHYVKYDEEGKVGGAWIDQQREWLPRRVCNECWAHRAQIHMPDSTRGHLGLQTEIVENRGFDFFQRKLYSSTGGVDLDEIEASGKAAETAVVAATWKAEGSLSSRKKDEVQLVTNALAEMGLEACANKIIKVNKISTVQKLEAVRVEQMLAMGLDRNERKRLNAWIDGRAELTKEV